MLFWSSDGIDWLSLSLPFRLFRTFGAGGGAILGCSSGVSSRSSCFERLDRDEDVEGVRRVSFERGPDSETGDGAGDLLEEADGTERRPERRGSLGDGGGPM